MNLEGDATVDDARIGHRGPSSALARGVATVQRRWTLLVVEALLRRGPLRFVDLRGELTGVSPNVLAQRLRELATDGLLTHRRLAAPAASWVYELTDRGRGLEPMVRALEGWALGLAATHADTEGSAIRG